MTKFSYTFKEPQAWPIFPILGSKNIPENPAVI